MVTGLTIAFSNAGAQFFFLVGVEQRGVVDLSKVDFKGMLDGAGLAGKESAAWDGSFGWSASLWVGSDQTRAAKTSLGGFNLGGNASALFCYTNVAYANSARIINPLQLTQPLLPYPPDRIAPSPTLKTRAPLVSNIRKAPEFPARCRNFRRRHPKGRLERGHSVSRNLFHIRILRPLIGLYLTGIECASSRQFGKAGQYAKHRRIRGERRISLRCSNG